MCVLSREVDLASSSSSSQCSSAPSRTSSLSSSSPPSPPLSIRATTTPAQASSVAALATLSLSSIHSLVPPAASYQLEDISLVPFVLVGTLDGRIHRSPSNTRNLRQGMH
jgi:hypothetical protein